MPEKPHKSGFVAIIGKPNAGKSTLLNAILDRKLVITTAKPQTTRHRILGILSEDDFQIVFSDTPGVILPKYGLQKSMMRSVRHSLEDADVVLLVIDVHEKFPEDEMISLAEKCPAPKILAINKTDLANDQKIKARISEISEKITPSATIEIAALHNTNVPELVDLIVEHLPEGPAYFDKDSLSDRPERFFVSEMVREKLFQNLEEELPYSCEVAVMDFKEEENIIRITADIHVERKSQKGMIIGKGGSMIKKIGMESRKDLEEFLKKKVFLELYVRVSENWKDNNLRLRNFGYEK